MHGIRGHRRSLDDFSELGLSARVVTLAEIQWYLGNIVHRLRGALRVPRTTHTKPAFPEGVMQIQLVRPQTKTTQATTDAEVDRKGRCAGQELPRD